MTTGDDYAAAIEAENETLRERVKLLEQMLGLRLEAPPALNLTGKETQMFGLLLRLQLLSKAHAMSQLYSGAIDGGPDPKIVDVFICKLRAKLEPFGMKIETIWGQGYRMSGASKAIARKMLGEAEAA